MTTFDEREKGFEEKFRHDQELAFKAKARRDKLLGLWAAGLMGLTGAAADAYAADIVAADLQPRGEEHLVKKITRDLAAKGVKIDGYRVREELHRCAAEAKKQLGIPS